MTVPAYAVASWPLGAVANVVVSVAYLMIATVIGRGLVETHQLKTNPLAVATGVIFFSCGVGHGLHGYHLIVPMGDMGAMGGMRMGWTWSMSLWDGLTACVALTYLAMRSRFPQLLRTPEMFVDEVVREQGRAIGDVLRLLPGGVIVVGANGDTEQVNPAAERLGTLAALDGGAIAAVSETTRLTGRPVDDRETDIEAVAGERRRVRYSTRVLDPEGEPPYRVVVSVVDITERHEAREALRESESRNRSIVESLHEGVVLQQIDNTIVAGNQRAEVLLGLTRDQMIGRRSIDPRWRAVHDDGSAWPGEEHPVPRALASGKHIGPETMGIHTPDGQLRWIEVNATPLKDDRGAVTGAVSSFVDVTGRRRAEDALRATEQELRATLDGLSEAVIVYDTTLRVRATNRSAAELLQLTPEELHETLHGRGPVELRDLEGRPFQRATWPSAVVAATGERVMGERLAVHYPHLPGRPDRWIEVNAVPLGDAADLPCEVIVSFSDVTDRVLRERALKEAQQRVRASFELAPVGMKVMGLDGAILEANQALADLMGRSIDEVVGMHSAELHHPEDAPAQRLGEAQLLAGELDVFRMETRLLHAAGHALWVQLDLTLLRDADGAPSGYIGQLQDVSERRRHEQQLRHVADHDMLTGLLNRRGFQHELERHVGQAKRYESAGALLMLDLDNFKYVNDTLGHKAGDDMIVAVADLLRRRMRETDVIARLGGDEFAILLPRGGEAEAEATALSVGRLLREREPDLPGANRRATTASIGVATVGTGDLTADELLVNADLAMYEAKEAGRDRCATYAASRYEEPRTKSRLTWMDRIASALQEDRFALMAQPILRLSDDSVSMHELLLRMRGEGGDLIPPAAFLYIAERFDLIQDIDRWVVDAACGLLEGRAPGGPALTVNISGKSLDDPGTLIRHLDAALERTGARPDELVVEITETAAVSQIHHARTFAGDLRGLGCRLAIDDFGAGFGSFYYLKHLPLDFLKIDGDFVTHARTSEPDAVIVRAMRDMAHGLGREVIAEYCSDEHVLAYLREEGIDFAQGFHLGKPVPAEGAVRPELSGVGAPLP